MILSSIQVVDLWWLAKGDFPMTFGIMDRWSYYSFKSLTCRASSRKMSTWLLELWIDDSIIHSTRWYVVILQGGYLLKCWNYWGMILSSILLVDLWSLANRDFPWLLQIWIGDPIIHPTRCFVVTRQRRFHLDCLELWIDDRIIHSTRWYVVIRQGGFPFEFWNYRGMILSSILVVDLWCLANRDFPLTIANMDRWFYHPSKSLTCEDSPRGISPWLLELWIDDSIIHPGRWLVAIRKGEFLLDFGNYGSIFL